MSGMHRREFLQAGAALGLASFSGVDRIWIWEQPDLVLRRAMVFDGTGAPGMEADVAILGDRIQAVGRVSDRGKMEIDLAGHALSPGFIDIHTHADLPILANPRMEKRCGGRSAYSRPGGASPLCYESDISDVMVKQTREKYPPPGDSGTGTSFPEVWCREPIERFS